MYPEPKRFIVRPDEYDRYRSNSRVDYGLLVGTINFYMLKFSAQVDRGVPSVVCCYTGRQIVVPEEVWSHVDKGSPGDPIPDVFQRFIDREVNEEHVIPASIYDRQLPIVVDLHNILPCSTVYNAVRSNFKYLDDDSIPVNAKICHGGLYKNLFMTEYDPPRKFPHSQSCTGLVVSPGQTGYGPLGGAEDRFELEKLKGYYDEIAHYGPFKRLSVHGCLFGKCFFRPQMSALRGLLARAVLYFQVVYASNPALLSSYGVNTSKFDSLYGQFLDPESFGTACRWHLAWGPTPYELGRNRRIAAFQGYPNPFCLESAEARRGVLDRFFSQEPVVPSPGKMSWLVAVDPINRILRFFTGEAVRLPGSGPLKFGEFLDYFRGRSQAPVGIFRPHLDWASRAHYCDQRANRRFDARDYRTDRELVFCVRER
jgi:endonuclease I